LTAPKIRVIVRIKILPGVLLGSAGIPKEIKLRRIVEIEVPMLIEFSLSTIRKYKYNRNAIVAVTTPKTKNTAD
jgi:hypothetical protein